MATELPIRPRRLLRSSQHHYAIVESQYNSRFVRPMADRAETELHEIDPAVFVDRVEAPGAFEIPLIVKALLERRKYHAILALGLIIKGETAHADLIAETVTHSLQKLALEYNTPVIHEVLLVSSEAQATERCLGEKINRGIEAARAACAAAQILEEITPQRLG